MQHQIKTEFEKNQQIKKEALASIALYVAFFIWWYVTGYGLAGTGTPQTYTYVMGLPMWFFLGNICDHASHLLTAGIQPYRWRNGRSRIRSHRCCNGRRLLR